MPTVSHRHRRKTDGPDSRLAKDRGNDRRHRGRDQPRGNDRHCRRRDQHGRYNDVARSLCCHRRHESGQRVAHGNVAAQWEGAHCRRRRWQRQCFRERGAVDPSAGTFTANWQYDVARELHTATLLHPVRGHTAARTIGTLGSSRDAELYDPAPDFTGAGSMTAGKGGHTGKPLPCATPWPPSYCQSR